MSDTSSLNTTANHHDTTPTLDEIQQFQLEQFEYLVNTDQQELAARQLLFLLRQIDNNYGMWGDKFSAFAPGQTQQTLNPHICTRLAGALTTLFSHPQFNISDDGFAQLMNLHRWIGLIFSVSSYRHADHIIRNHNAAGGGIIDPLTLNGQNLKLFCLCYHLDSEIALQPEVLWQYDKQTVARLFFALLSSRVMPTVQAHSKREQLLAWLPERLLELDSLEFLPTGVLHDVYMHCSYADLPDKHHIKHSINTLIRRTLLAQGFQDKTTPADHPSTDKPLMLIVLEWFTCQHSVYRTHSSAFNALREHFTVHAVALNNAVDDLSEKTFDVCHKYKSDEAFISTLKLIDELKPDIVYYAGIGMFPYTIYLSNLKLAPVQLVGLGHGASTFCDQIDGFVVEEDFVGDEACFSEQVIKVDKDAMPFVPPAQTSRNVPVRQPFAIRQQQTQPFPLPVRIAVCASIMKINPGFLQTLAEIEQRSQLPIQLCFYMGFSHGLTQDYLLHAIHAILPGAEVNAHLPVQEYQQALNSCELFINPFPYGNMNGVVDVIRQGLPGVCLSGPEVHTHIDEGLFRRLGLPEALIAKDKEHYIRAVIRLTEDHHWREQLQKQLHDNDVEQVLFKGQPEKFANVVYAYFKQHQK